MSEVLLTILNMSITASFAAALILAIRLLFKKAPKIFSYVLWAVVFFRLLCPVSFESPVSVIPSEAASVKPEEIFHLPKPAVETTVNHEPVGDNIEGAITSPAEQSKSPGTFAITPIQILTVLWLLGMILMLARAALSYFKLKRKLVTATRLQGNLYETDRIQCAFILGFLRPKIYLPAGLTALETDCVVSHELAHIKRGDHLLKALAYVALALHWFNPVVWLAYHFMVKDMEMSCDESVLKKASGDIRLGYSASLLAMSLKQSGIAFPVAFGESRTKSRIKNVLNYKRPVLWVLLTGAIAVAAIFIAVASNPKRIDSINSETMNGNAENADGASSPYTNHVTLDYSLINQNIMSLLFGKEKGKISSYRKEKQIYLVDFAVEKGTPFYALKEGTVKLAAWNGGYGNCVIIDHGDGVESRYGHCSEMLVKEGDVVKTGDLIGKVGSTGNATGPHLHFEVYENGVSIDPAEFLKELKITSAEESSSKTLADDNTTGEVTKLEVELIPSAAQEKLFHQSDIVVSSYFQRYNIYSVDFAAGKGTEIYSPAEGKVIFSEWDEKYGNCIVIDHGKGIETKYGHCSELLVKKGDTVKAGDLIGKVGSTGYSTGPHLHFEVYENGVSIDPAEFF